MPRTIITGTGSYIPSFVQSNQDFANHLFYSQDQQALTTEPGEVVNKFKQITGIEERRYTTDNLKKEKRSAPEEKRKSYKIPSTPKGLVKEFKLWKYASALPKEKCIW